MTKEIIIDYKKECSNLLAEKNALLCRYEEIREQLKQAENTVNECHKYLAELEDKIERLEQENKELKIYIESNKQQVEEAEMLVMDNDRLQQEVENLKDTIYYDVEKYRSALEEIRKILTDEYYVDTVKAIHKVNEVLDES